MEERGGEGGEEEEGERERKKRAKELQQKTHNAKRLLWRLRTTTPTVWKLFPGFVSPFNFEKVLWKLYEAHPSNIQKIQKQG